MPSADGQYNHQEIRQIPNQGKCANPSYIDVSIEYHSSHRKERTVLA